VNRSIAPAPVRVIVTRPAEQATDWVDALRALGIDAVALPLIGIQPLADLAPLQRAWSELAGCALVMFVSPNAVRHFFAAACGPWPPQLLAGSTGPGTSAALRAAGVTADQLVEPPADAPTFDSEALWPRLAGRDWRGRRVLIVRGEDGRDWFAETVRSAGAEVQFVAAYRRAGPDWGPRQVALLTEALAAPQRHLWLFSSSEAVRHLAQRAGDADWSRAQAAASHPRIASAAREAGFGVVHEVRPAPVAVAALVRAITSPDGTSTAHR
jgi:uroporphyrinogen-III synthase